MENNQFIITREKHLDHLVRVAPLIVLGYAVQCYVFTQMGNDEVTTMLLFLGLSLVALIGGFITYDIYQEVHLSEDHLHISFLGSHKIIPFKDISSLDVQESENSFGSILIKTHGSKKIQLYFVDEPAKIKEWIESRQETCSLAA